MEQCYCKDNMIGTGNDPQCAYCSTLYITLPPTVSEHTLFSCANIVLAQMLYNIQSVNATAGVNALPLLIPKVKGQISCFILLPLKLGPADPATVLHKRHCFSMLALILPGFFLFDLCCTVRLHSSAASSKTDQMVLGCSRNSPF